ncbi:hypothetical protein [Kitasatospora griseola]
MSIEQNEAFELQLRWENPDSKHALDRWNEYTVTITRRQIGDLLTAVDDMEFDPDLFPAALTKKQRCTTLHLPNCGCGEI